VPETYPLDEFLPRLREAAVDLPRLGVPSSAARAYAPPGLPEALTLQQQFAQSLETALPGKEPLNVAPVLERLRLVKDPAEIAVMRQAARISGEGLIAAMKAARPGLKDREIAGLMEYTWKRLGAQRASFPPVVSSGPAAMTLFTVQQEDYNAGDRVMQAGDLLFMDYGAAEYNTYATDICRTIPVSGRFTPAQRRYYDIVLEAQLAAIDSVKPGIAILDAIRAAARVFRKHGLEQYEDIGRMGEDHVWGVMPSPTYYLAKHGGLVPYSARGLGVRDLGHHIGLEAQDSRDYSQPLQPGMVFTMEPKLYIPDETITIMIEDMILVTETGREVLSRAVPKKAEEIERLMRRR
jgi:Xaa-Pro aminopeptidase